MFDVPYIPKRDLFRWGEINPFLISKNSTLFSKDKKWFAYARQALTYGLQTLGISSGDRVLVPDYICNVIESAFYQRSVGVVYYNINEDLTPNFIDIERKIDRKTKALLCVNYFGNPAPFEAIKKFCTEFKLQFIEDNAHGFLSSYEGIPLGDFGDISITSVRKSIPVMHGAYLKAKKGSEFFKEDEPTYSVSESSLRYLYRYGRKWIGQSLRNRSGQPGRIEKNFRWENSNNPLPDPLMEVRFSGLAESVLKAVDIEIVRESRRSKYEQLVGYLEGALNSYGKMLLTKIHPGTVPLQIPFVLSGRESERNELLSFLRSHSIEVSYWPDLPEAVTNGTKNYPAANFLKQNLVHFLV